MAMDNSTGWLGRLGLLALCAPLLHGGFLALSDPEAMAALFRIAGRGPLQGGNASMMVVNAVAAAVVILFAGKPRRYAAAWLAGITLLGAFGVFPFWTRSGVAATVTLQQFLSLGGFAAAFLLISLGLGTDDRDAA